ncbi:MAG: hypothetical protein HY059_22790 [Proteobacteria bacterium]|nr:hypothetical protein [Pseudomonadota bacterium]
MIASRGWLVVLIASAAGAQSGRTIPPGDGVFRLLPGAIAEARAHGYKDACFSGVRLRTNQPSGLVDSPVNEFEFYLFSPSKPRDAIEVDYSEPIRPVERDPFADDLYKYRLKLGGPKNDLRACYPRLAVDSGDALASAFAAGVPHQGNEFYFIELQEGAKADPAVGSDIARWPSLRGRVYWKIDVTISDRGYKVFVDAKSRRILAKTRY